MTIDFIHPAPGSKLTSPFGMRLHPITKKYSGHQGCDFAKSGKVPILASRDGLVQQYISDNTTYGKVLFIQHTVNGKRMDTTYAHLDSKLVKKGDIVKQGQIIGYMGNTGGSTGQHLHFEIHDGPWLSGQPNAIDPMLWIDKVRKEEVKLEENKVDLTKPAAWAEESWAWAKAQEILDGTRPYDEITRQEIAKALKSLHDLIKK